MNTDSDGKLCAHITRLTVLPVSQGASMYSNNCWNINHKNDQKSLDNWISSYCFFNTPDENAALVQSVFPNNFQRINTLSWWVERVDQELIFYFTIPSCVLNDYMVYNHCAHTRNTWACNFFFYMDKYSDSQTRSTSAHLQKQSYHTKLFKQIKNTKRGREILWKWYRALRDCVLHLARLYMVWPKWK